MLAGKKLIVRSAKEAGILHAIAHPHRIAILHLLSQSDMRLKELAIHMPCSQSLLAHHLKELIKVGFVTRYQIGARMFYKGNKKTMIEVENVFRSLSF